MATISIPTYNLTINQNVQCHWIEPTIDTTNELPNSSC